MSTKINQEVYVITSVDKHIFIPKGKRSFPNEEDVVFDFKAGVPLKVPVYFAERFPVDYPSVYKVLTDDEAKEILKGSVTATTPDPGNKVPSTFDATEFLNNNHPLTGLALEQLEESDLFAISALLNLKINPRTGAKKHRELILAEVEARNEQ